MPTDDRPLDQSLDGLRSRARLLARRSDALNQLIDNVEKALRDAGVCFESTVWEEVGHKPGEKAALFLGWAEDYEDGWSLVLVADGDSAHTVLRRASRRLRIAAVPKLSKLVAQIASEVDDQLMLFDPIEKFLPPDDDWEDPTSSGTPIRSDDPDEIPF